MRKLKNALTLNLIFFVIIIPTYSQNFSIKAEGYNYRVKLIWHTHKWEDDLLGFNLKRRIDDSEFLLINNRIITIENHKNKSLDNVIANDSDLDYYTDLMLKLYDNGSLEEATAQEVHEYATNDLPSINYVTYSSFLDALITGFAYLDNDIPKNAKNVEYALYTVLHDGTEKLQDTWSWEVGEDPNLTFNWDFRYELFNGRELKLFWSVGKEEIQNNPSAKMMDIRAYRIDSLGNEELVDWPFASPDTINNRIEYEILDKYLDLKQHYTYKAVPHTYFGYEEEPIYFEYDPNVYFTDLVLSKPLVDWVDPDAKGIEKLKKGIKISLNIDPKYYKDIESLTLTSYSNFSEFSKEKREDSVYIGSFSPEVSTLIDSQIREKDQNIFYVAHADFKREIESQYAIKQFRYNRPYIPDLSYTATNLRGEVINEDGTYKVKFTWEAPEKSDEIEGYRLAVAYYRGDGLAVANDLPLITDTGYVLTPWNNLGDHMGFAVVSIKEDGSQARPWSKPLSFTTPSNLIYNVREVKASLAGNIATLTWEYSELVKDLEKFEIYRNKELVDTLMAEEGQTVFSWTSEELPSGKSTFQVKAATMYGLKTPLSFPESVVVE